MTEIIYDINAPRISADIKESIENVTDGYFAVQLTYRENHTLYPLDRIRSIRFDRSFLKIEHCNGTCNWYCYEQISEYHVISADEMADMWRREI